MAAIAIVASLFGPITPVATAGGGEGCHSKSCERRVEKKRDVHARYSWCNTWRCVRRQDRRAARRQDSGWESYVAPYRGWLARTRACESGGNYRAIDPTGTYTGAYQFDDHTWRSVGGSGRAMWAAPLEQDYRAVRLYRERGSAPWPVCG